MNRKSLLLVLILCALLMCALLTRNGRPLLLALPISVYLLVGYIQAPVELNLTAKRALDKTSVTAGQAVEMQTVIKNQGMGLANLSLLDRLSPSVTLLEGSAEGRLALPPEGKTELRYSFTAGRGVYSWGAISARASDPLGLFVLESEIPTYAGLLVRPAPMKTRSLTLKPRYTLHAPGQIPARLSGAGTDFWGVREYRTGDSLRQINWRLKARHPRKLFANEYERQEIADFGLILDTRRLSGSESLEGSLFESSVRAAASLSESLLKNGNRVSLLVYGKPINSVYPGYGKHHLNSLLHSLSDARLGEYVPFSYLEYFPTRLFPARSVIVIFSIVDTRDLEVYARLRSYGYEVLLISPDPVAYAFSMLPRNQINSLALRAARVERFMQLERLVKLGVKVVDWQVDQPLESIIHKILNHQMHTRRIPERR